MVVSLLKPEERDRVELFLKYIEDVDLRRQSLPDIRAFAIGIDEWRLKLNCLTNPYMFEQVRCYKVLILFLNKLLRFSE